MRGLGVRARHEVDLVTNPSVEPGPASPVCWYGIRSLRSDPVLLQQGTDALDDGVYPWMASVAQDKKSNIAVGFTVSNGSSVFPDIRYTGRLKGDELNHLPRPPGPQAHAEHARSDSDRLPLKGVGWLGAAGAHQDGPASGMTTPEFGRSGSM